MLILDVLGSRTHSFLSVGLVLLASVACHSVQRGRYVVTATPIEVGVGTPLCVAIDPTNPRGVWWWQSWRTTDCETRSTGPGIFTADRANLTRSGNDTSDVRFRVPTLTGDVDIHLLVDARRFRTPSGTYVDTTRRADLNLPGHNGG